MCHLLCPWLKASLIQLLLPFIIATSNAVITRRYWVMHNSLSLGLIEHKTRKISYRIVYTDQQNGDRETPFEVLVNKRSCDCTMSCDCMKHLEEYHDGPTVPFPNGNKHLYYLGLKISLLEIFSLLLLCFFLLVLRRVHRFNCFNGSWMMP